MADPLSITASIIAISTLGLQSAKFIHETLFSLCQSRKEFSLAGESLENLLRILEQIRRLTQALRPSTLFRPAISNGANSNTDDELFLKELEVTVKNCEQELKPIVAKVKKWKDAETGSNGVLSAVRWHVRDSNLKKIHELVSRQILSLNAQLNISSYAQVTNHAKSTMTANTKTSDKLTNLSAEVKHSMSSVTSHLSSSLQQTQVTLSSNHGELKDAITNNSVIQQDQVRGLIRTVERSVSIGFRDQLQTSEEQAWMLKEILELQHKLVDTKKNEESEDLNQTLQDCIDRLYDLKDSGRGNLDFDSSKAQLIQEDLVCVLKILLKQIGFPKLEEVNRKRKRAGEDQDQESTEMDRRTEEKRVAKRMRGILDSSQTVQFRDSNWQNGRAIQGRKLQSHNRFWETPIGTLGIMAATIEPTVLDDRNRTTCEPLTQAFAASLTLMPKTKRRKMKLRIFFAQHFTKNGAFSFAPTLSFHAIIPNGSPVIRCVGNNDLDGLKKLLHDGLASLTDCDEKGNPLLYHAICVESGLNNGNLDICEYLLSKGADANGFVPLGDSCKEMISLLSFLLLVGKEYGGPSRTANCVRLLLAAGADPSLFFPDGNVRCRDNSLHDAVMTHDMDILRAVLDHGGALLDFEMRDQDGSTALLVALSQTRLLDDKNAIEIYCEKANLLMDRGASCLASDDSGSNCLHWLLLFKYIGIDGVFFLPRKLHTNLLVRTIQAGANVYAANSCGRSPSHYAKGNNYEWSWRHALTQCGYCPQEVYGKSGVEWKEVPDIIPNEELIELFTYIDAVHSHKKKAQWTPGKLQEAMTEMIQSGVDLFQCMSPSGKTIAQLAIHHHADKQLREALETCGFDPEEVYRNSGAPWGELQSEDESEHEGEDEGEDEGDGEYGDDEGSEDYEYCEDHQVDGDNEGVDAVENEEGNGIQQKSDPPQALFFVESEVCHKRPAGRHDSTAIKEWSIKEGSNYDGYDTIPSRSDGGYAISRIEEEQDLRDLSIQDWIQNDDDNHCSLKSDHRANSNVSIIENTTPWILPQVTTETTGGAGDGGRENVLFQPPQAMLMDFTYESEVWGESNTMTGQKELC